MPFTGLDLEFVLHARQNQTLFRTINTNKLVVDGPIGVGICSDFVIKRDVDNHRAKIWQKIENDPQESELKLFGLPYYFDPNFPLNTEKLNYTLLAEIQLELGMIEQKIGLTRKKKRVINIGHYPCAAAKHAGYGLYECVKNLIAGKKNIEAKFLNLEMILWMHINYEQSSMPEKGKKTYHIDSGIWDQVSSEFSIYSNKMINTQSA